MRALGVVGARPNFMKMASVAEALRRQGVEFLLVHTGQHYDRNMSQLFFEELGLPRPDVYLGVGSASHALQTAEIMRRFEPVLLEQRPDVVVVVGDVNSTLACALVAAKAVYPSGRRPLLAHVEAGLRSFDRTMPEEVNRVLTDALSDLLFATEQDAVDNLLREGRPEEAIFLVGNTMIDTLLRHRQRAERTEAWRKLGLEPGGYALLTLHRPRNVDDPAVLGRVLGAMERISGELPVVFPVHPRTRERLCRFGMEGRLGRLVATEPLGYLEFLCLMAHARLVLTDSGGIQEETTVLGVPCLTLRPHTERPVTVTMGTNIIVGNDLEAILEGVRRSLDGSRPHRIPPLWDGRAGERIARILTERLR